MRRHALDTAETIFALTTGALPSAVAIVKVAGPRAFAIAQQLFRGESGALPRERGVRLGAFFDGDGAEIDRGLVLTFVAPHSHSGDDTVEFHLHGAVPVVRAMETALGALGARPAERGEFTYRALVNGKASPAEVERLAELFLLRQPADLRALYRRDEAMAREMDRFRTELVRLQAIFDTAVDFSEEYSAVIHAARQPLETAIHGCSAAIRRYSSLKNGQFVPKIVLAGRPNAGKSSLFNGLLCRYRALVHEEAGTTRDVIEETIELDGRPWALVDTAGVRTVGPGAEREGIELGAAFLEASQCWLLVVDGTVGWGEAEAALWKRYRALPHLVLWNKADLPEWQPPPAELGALPVSAREADGLVVLAETLRQRVHGVQEENTGPLPTATEAAKLAAVLGGLEALRVSLAAEAPPEILGEANRSLLRQLESVVGEVTVEDVLDRVFREFCIGK